MHLKDANELLDNFYLPFESGWKRLDTGVIHIGVRTHMVGVTPAMIDWWLGFLHHTEEYPGGIPAIMFGDRSYSGSPAGAIVAAHYWPPPCANCGPLSQRSSLRTDGVQQFAA